MAVDAMAVLTQAGAGAADVMGYSMGAQVAIRLMHDHPAAFGRCVLAGAGETYFALLPEITEAIARGLESDDASGIGMPIAREFRAFCERAGDDLKAMAACMRRKRQIFRPRNSPLLLSRCSSCAARTIRSQVRPRCWLARFRMGKASRYRSAITIPRLATAFTRMRWSISLQARTEAIGMADAVFDWSDPLLFERRALG